MNWTHLEVGSTAHGRYRVERLLGEGGFGAAYLCSDLERFEKPCVLKELRPEFAYADKASELFEREAKVLLSLSHPSIPSMHAFFEKDERFYLVQEYVDGTTLDQMLRERGPLSEEEVRDYVTQILEVLQYLHARTPPLIHRDIKPANLIVDAAGRVYLIDFGAVLEAMTRLDGAPVTVIGTPGYTPLEQGMGAPVPSSDIYALGATGLQLISGRPPNEWHDRASGRMTALTGRLGCSAEFEQILSKMLAELPDDRFRTAADAIDALVRPAAHPTSAPPTVTPGHPGQHSAQAAIPTRVTSTSGSVAAAGADDPWGADPSDGRSMMMRRVAIGAGVVLTAGAVWFITTAGSGAEESQDGDGLQEEPVGTPDTAAGQPLPIPLLARTTTRAGLALSVNYPATWQLMTDQQHIAIRDPGTGTVFVTGMERSRGPQGPPGTLAAQLTEDPGERYGQIAVTEQLPPSGDLAPFRLNAFRGGSADPGTLVIRQFTARDETFSLWWMTIGNDRTTTPTVDAMAQSIVTQTN